MGQCESLEGKELTDWHYYCLLRAFDIRGMVKLNDDFTEVTILPALNSKVKHNMLVSDWESKTASDYSAEIQTQVRRLFMAFHACKIFKGHRIVIETTLAPNHDHHTGATLSIAAAMCCHQNSVELLNLGKSDRDAMASLIAEKCLFDAVGELEYYKYLIKEVAQFDSADSRSTKRATMKADKKAKNKAPKVKY
jgi:hypothetical protein